MLGKISLVLSIITIFSCKGVQANNQLLKDINKIMVYFNYSNNEICLLDIGTGKMLKSHKLDFHVQQYGIDKYDYGSVWYYSNGDENIYLMRGYKDWNDRSNNNTKIYRINIETFETSEIFYSTEDFNNFCVLDSHLYLLSYVEPSSGRSNIERNFIVKYDLSNDAQEFIYFNKLLSESEQIYAPDFYITENTIILNGWHRILQFKNLYKYNLATEAISIIDENVVGFSIIEDKILYRKNDIKLDYSNGFESINYIDSKLVLNDLTNDTTIVLPDTINTDILAYFLIKKDVMIFTREHTTIKTLINKYWLFPNYDNILRDYYIADIHGNEQKIFFQSNDSIGILGVTDNN